MKRFPAHDELGTCRISLVCLEQPVYQCLFDAEETVLPCSQTDINKEEKRNS